jgi:hypothetical protein
LDFGRGHLGSLEQAGGGLLLQLEASLFFAQYVFGGQVLVSRVKLSEAVVSWERASARDQGDDRMARPPKFDAKKKQQIVLAVLRGELSVAEAARRHGFSETSVAKWRDQFIEGGVAAFPSKSWS